MPEDSRRYATGKRKTAVARVWVAPGEGAITVNERGYEAYFPRVKSRLALREPFDAIQKIDAFDVTASVAGGGPVAQAEAVRAGIARALLAVDPEFRSPLKKAGLLTRDAREKERKKYGQPGARKRYQYSKR